jgi:SAM-dependent methyltransferase
MSWDPSWETTFSSSEWGKYPSEDVVRFVAQRFYQSPDRKAVRILELGSGPGANLWFSAREGFTTYGIDGSQVAVSLAKNRLDIEVPGWSGEVVVGDISSLPYPANTFDAVIDNEAIYANSWDSSKLIYAEAYRVLRLNGWLYSKTFASGCIGDGTGQSSGYNGWYADRGPLAGKGLSRFTLIDDVPQLLERFKITNLEQVTRTAENRTQMIKEWIIIAQKVSSIG